MSLPQITRGDDDLQEKKQPITLAGIGICRPETPVRAVYAHVPFCFHKCHYCDFYSIVDTHDRFESFTTRLIDEVEAASPGLSEPIRTIFVGGGTPTLLPTECWRRILSAINRSLRLDPDIEFTVEANPETVTADLLDVLREGGVNRVSIGAQSFQPGHLKTLERWHDPENVDKAVEHARVAGFKSINLDLIFAIPGQTTTSWVSDLEMALRLQPDHLSCYGLMYEPNTPMRTRRDRGEILPVDDAVEAEMYEATRECLGQDGFEQYEISNWARPGHRCRHNLVYWRNENWWALGPSAAGHVNGVRWRNVPRLSAYLEGEGPPEICDVEHLDEDGQVGEALMLGLRLLDGVERERVGELLQRGRRSSSRRDAIEQFVRAGFLIWENDALRLTDVGLLQADTVLCELL